MGFLDTLEKQKEARPMMGRAGFSIQRPSPRVRLDKFKAVIDPRMMEQEGRPAPYDGQGFERLTGNPANADVNIDPNAEMPMGNDLPSQGGITGQQKSDSESEVANILAEISGIQGKDYGPRKKGGFKDILLGLGLGALQGVANSDPRGGLGAMLGGAIGGGAAGGIGGAVDGSTDNRMRDRLRLDRLYGDYGQASKVADIEQSRKYKQWVMDNGIRDDKARDEKTKADLVDRRRKGFTQRYKNFDPKNATPAQVRELAEFGETPDSIGAYDFTKRDFKQIGGDTYKYDANAGAFVATNLPTDKSKELTSLTFETPEKEVVTFWVPSSQAATIQAGRERMGWSFKQRQELQEDAQNFKVGMKNQPTSNSANYTSPTTPTAPVTPPRGALESGLKARGIKPGSPEYIKVMKAAGY